MQRHGSSLNVLVETTDDKLVTAREAAGLQDRIIVVMQASDIATREEAVVGTKSQHAYCQARESEKGMIAQFALGLPAQGSTFRLNVGWVDVDRPENTKPSVLWWRPPAQPTFGQFSLDD
ncbi:MAG TPA: hypothetical protein PLV87_15490 [Opitutaceae bacterium]|nr:hypothetical protein [Opitutaceae bacterium]